MKTSIHKYFRRQLKSVSVQSGILKLLRLPFQLFAASITGSMIIQAIAGNVKLVLWQGGALLISTFLYKILSVYLTIIYKKHLEIRQQNCKMQLYRSYMDNPLYRLYSFRQGAFLERVNDDLSTVTGKIVNVIPTAIVSFVSALVYFVYLGKRNWLLTLIFLGMGIIQMVPELLIRKFERENYEELRQVEAQMTDVTLEAYRGFSTIKLYQLKDWYLNRVKALHRKYLQVGYRSSGTSAVEESAQTFIKYMLQYGTCMIAGLFVLLGNTELEAAISAIAVSGSFFSEIKSIFSVIPEFSVARAAMERLDEWMPVDEKLIKVSSSDAVLDNLSFAYGEKVVFKQLHMKLDTQGICVMKGQNGSGKSTLLKILCGLEHGEKIMDDVIYLPQERLSIDQSASEWLQLLPLSEQDILQSNLEEFRLDDQLLQKKISELSGGEEKKLMLSVILSKPASLVLLDEPFAPLDEKGKQVLRSLLVKRGGGVIVVTHGKEMDDIADQIVTLNTYSGAKKNV